jgi:hypothetical protein
MLAAFVLLPLASRHAPIVLWTIGEKHTYTDPIGRPYHGELLNELTHPNGSMISFRQSPDQLIVCLPLQGIERPSVATGSRNHPDFVGTLILVWSPPVEHTKTGFHQRKGRLWVSPLQSPRNSSTLDLGVATGSWHTVGIWKSDGRTKGPKFLTNIITHHGSVEDHGGSHLFFSFDIAVPSHFQTDAIRVEAFDTHGKVLMPSGSARKTSETSYWFQTEATGAEKLGSIQLETRPYHWSKIPIKLPAS